MRPQSQEEMVATNASCHAIRSQEEVAKLLGVSRMAVWQAEKRALGKLARHPVLKKLWLEMVEK